MSTKYYLRKRANGIYYVGYWEGNHKLWKSTREKTKTEALMVLRNFEEHLRKKLPDITFEQFVGQFKQLQGYSLRESTFSHIYQPTFDSFKRIIGNKPLSQYTLKDVEKYKAKRLEENCSSTTVNIAFRTLRAAFNYAVKWQLIRDNPFTASSQIKTGEALPIYLTRDEFQRVLNATSEQVLKDVFLMAVLTGMRLGELINLRWPAVDLQRRQITVENSATFQTKTGRVRVLPMAEAVYQMLLRRSTEIGWENLVFHRGFYPLLPGYVSNKFKKYADAVGLSKTIHFHSLRHTMATWLAKSGANIYQIQKLLGHSSVKTSEIYSHLAASELHSTVEKINIPLN